VLRELEGEIAEDRRRDDRVGERLLEQRQREFTRLLEEHQAHARAEMEALRQQELALELDSLDIPSPCLGENDPLSVLPGDSISYRRITREDFRAPARLDVAMAVHVPGSQLGAHVALSFACRGRVALSSPRADTYHARMVDLRYESLLDREGSWWNPDAQGDEGWSLRHEQLHFDLAELHVRSFNADVEQIVAATAGSGATPVDAVRDLFERWADLREDQGDAFLANQLEYDLATVHGTDPNAQTRWFHEVKRDLAATGGLPE